MSVSIVVIGTALKVEVKVVVLAIFVTVVEYIAVEELVIGHLTPLLRWCRLSGLYSHGRAADFTRRSRSVSQLILVRRLLDATSLAVVEGRWVVGLIVLLNFDVGVVHYVVVVFGRRVGHSLAPSNRLGTAAVQMQACSAAASVSRLPAAPRLQSQIGNLLHRAAARKGSCAGSSFSACFWDEEGLRPADGHALGLDALRRDLDYALADLVGGRLAARGDHVRLPYQDQRPKLRLQVGNVVNSVREVDF